jgi:hypothetical protein
MYQQWTKENEQTLAWAQPDSTTLERGKYFTMLVTFLYGIGLNNPVRDKS